MRKFPGVTGLVVSTGDLTQWRAANSKSRTGDTCGTTGTRPCAIYDLDEAGLFISNGGLDPVAAPEQQGAGSRSARPAR